MELKQNKKYRRKESIAYKEMAIKDNNNKNK